MLRGQGMQRYLITGAAGNLARQLMDELIGRGKHTFGIDLVPAPTGQQGNWRQMDITDRESLAGLLAEFQPECILHMASLLSMSSAADPPRAWEVNASAAVALMELAVEHGVQRFFFPSTSATYGGALPDPLPEDHPQWPDNIYGATKVAVERVGTYFALSRGLDFRSVRLPIVVSPFAPPAAVSAYASQVFAAAARGEPFTSAPCACRDRGFHYRRTAEYIEEYISPICLRHCDQTIAARCIAILLEIRHRRFFTCFSSTL